MATIYSGDLTRQNFWEEKIKRIYLALGFTLVYNPDLFILEKLSVVTVVMKDGC